MGLQVHASTEGDQMAQGSLYFDDGDSQSKLSWNYDWVKLLSCGFQLAQRSSSAPNSHLEHLPSVFSTCLCPEKSSKLFQQAPGRVTAELRYTDNGQSSELGDLQELFFEHVVINGVDFCSAVPENPKFSIKLNGIVLQGIDVEFQSHPEVNRHKLETHP